MRKVRHPHAFTLVELLVVIGIIAILIAILMPALTNARRSSNTVKCLSNLRQVGIAVQMYAGDFKGMMPVTRQDAPPGKSGDTYYWMDALAPYASRLANSTYGATDAEREEFRKSVFFGCTEYDARTDVAIAALVNAYPGYAFSLHPYFGTGVQARNKTLTNARWTVGDVYPGQYYRLGSITRSSERVLAADSFLWLLDARPSSGGGVDGLPGQPVDWKSTNAGGVNVPGLIDYDMYRHVKKPNAKTDGYYPVRAKAGCNVVFFDGHAATLTGWADAYRGIFLQDPP
jgi:prepilin-type N-terminal cleavage/methylation domain-containing protein/prepilin-type processing-associated H-X9-DG protein